ncbi:Crp/Fnr family transcriptional regulator [Parapedobacter tibetensis]|uniref:Crp/Fnr family transcriptional regulator n=1 Tax=Parapedobacter tibetensis TaxID=2972951 RepID=UPI00214DD710|nr:Crp/Fnr family transcriptional regulator [Parapedobacter tibetensis]
MKNLVRHIQNYVHLTDSDIKRLYEETQVISIKKKEFLLQEGGICQSDYFVSQGCLRMYFIKENGTEQITQFAIENWWMSDYMSLMTQKASPFYLQTIENAKIIRLNASSAERLFEDVPVLERYFRLVRQHAYAASQFRIKFLYDYSREELYRHFSSHFPEFVQRVPQYMLASYLGFTPEYLSEIRKKT